ncbi:CYFA0S09e01640g1_1 [Cyberlindnera fabianii]|uniref:CYFA0S09e01640g1_1 n=1 Tax=Cyberlindnera fabianii TaxID=36022 RepID=A0A061AXP8_CYBFA|nr:UV-induced protein uvi15 [Cyberlindnera fabianii]CDR42346.1 CYFA0S09e01640g1_1 [Cyberlindnera fabianii]
MSAEKYYNNSNQDYAAPSGPPPSQQYSAPNGPPPSDGDRGFGGFGQQQYGGQQGYYQQGPPPQGYYQQGPPQQGYYQQQQPVYVQQQPQKSSGSSDCCMACLGALCICCTLDALF